MMEPAGQDGDAGRGPRRAPGEPANDRESPVSRDDVRAMVEGDVDVSTAARLSKAMVASARAAGARAVTSGQWLARVFLDIAPHVPIRDLETLRDHYDGRSGAVLAGELIKNAARVSAAVGAVSGAMIGAEELAPPAWITVPFELVVETIIVASVELKLVAELHEVYGRSVPGSPMERTTALVQAWAQRRGVTPEAVARKGGLAEVLGRGTRNEVVRMVRRRLMARLGRNTASLAPMFAGVVAGAEVNRRATRALGEAVIRDLAATR